MTSNLGSEIIQTHTNDLIEVENQETVLDIQKDELNKEKQMIEKDERIIAETDTSETKTQEDTIDATHRIVNVEKTTITKFNEKFSENKNNEVETEKIKNNKKELTTDKEKKQRENKREEIRKKLLEVLQKHFKPEFLNRVDDIIIFHTLRKTEIRQILDIQLNDIQKRLQKQKIKIKFTDKSKDFLAEKGYDPAFGARPLKRTLQNFLLDELAMEIIEGEITKGTTINIDVKKEQLVFM